MIIVPIMVMASATITKTITISSSVQSQFVSWGHMVSRTIKISQDIVIICHATYCLKIKNQVTNQLVFNLISDPSTNGTHIFNTQGENKYEYLPLSMHHSPYLTNLMPIHCSPPPPLAPSQWKWKYMQHIKGRWLTQPIICSCICFRRFLKIKMVKSSDLSYASQLNHVLLTPIHFSL